MRFLIELPECVGRGESPVRRFTLGSVPGARWFPTQGESIMARITITDDTGTVSEVMNIDTTADGARLAVLSGLSALDYCECDQCIRYAPARTMVELPGARLVCKACSIESKIDDKPGSTRGLTAESVRGLPRLNPSGITPKSHARIDPTQHDGLGGNTIPEE